MSGFKDDVISILRHNLMLNKESIGYIVRGLSSENTRELVEAIEGMGFIVTPRKTKPVINYDYIVISSKSLTSSFLLEAFERLSTNGLMIIETTGRENSFGDKYISLFANFVATKTKYDDRSYIVIHSGADYGN